MDKLNQQLQDSDGLLGDDMDTEDEADNSDLSPEQLRSIALAEVRSVQRMLQCDPADDLQEQLQARLEKARQEVARLRPGRYQLNTANRKLEKNLKAIKGAKLALE